jgi:hypothetical protein
MSTDPTALNVTTGLLVGVIACIALMLPLLLVRIRSIKPTLFFIWGTAGVLLFLLFDLLGHGVELPFYEVLPNVAAGEQSLSIAIVLAVVFISGLMIGYASMSYLSRRLFKPSGGAQFEDTAISEQTQLNGSPALRLTFLVALGIGLYNFLQGMGMGEAGRFTEATRIGSVASDGLVLAGLILPNGVKGLAIVGTALASSKRLSRKDLLIAGIAAGSPTILGVLFGIFFWNPYLFVGFFTLAAGALFFPIRELLRTVNVSGRRSLGAMTSVGGFALILITTAFVLEVNQYSLPELMTSFRYP